VLGVQEVGDALIGAGDRAQHIAGRAEAVGPADVEREDPRHGRVDIGDGVVADRVGPGQGRAVDGGQPATPVGDRRPLGLDPGGRDVREPALQRRVRAGVEAEFGRLLRILLQLLPEEGVEESREPGAFGGG
jgi:hypothetical protein